MKLSFCSDFVSNRSDPLRFSISRCHMLSAATQHVGVCLQDLDLQLVVEDALGAVAVLTLRVPNEALLGSGRVRTLGGCRCAPLWLDDAGKEVRTSAVTGHSRTIGSRPNSG